MSNRNWNSRERRPSRDPVGIRVPQVTAAGLYDPVSEVYRLIRDRVRAQSLQTGAVWPLAATVQPVIIIPTTEP